MYDTVSDPQGSVILGTGRSGSIEELRYTGPGDQNGSENATQPPVASEHHSHPVPTPVALYPVGSNQEAALLPAAELSCEGMPERLDPRSSSLQVSWRELLANEDDLWVW